MQDLLLRPGEVCAVLKLSRSKVYEMISSGEIPSIKIGGTRRVSVEVLKRYIAAKHEASGTVGFGDITRNIAAVGESLVQMTRVD